MIEAIIFDLDGTLVQTEILKAESYANAAVELSKGRIKTQEVIDYFVSVAGLSRKQVAENIINAFSLNEYLEEIKSKQNFNKQLWEIFVDIRLNYYKKVFDTPGLLKKFICPFNLHLLKVARKSGFKTALATMSYKQQVDRVIQILDIREDLDVITTKDVVKEGKPNPEIYKLVSKLLGVNETSCLVIEDSVNGIKAAKAAEMNVVAVTNSITRKAVWENNLLDKQFIVDNPEYLIRTVNLLLDKKLPEKNS